MRHNSSNIVTFQARTLPKLSPGPVLQLEAGAGVFCVHAVPAGGVHVPAADDDDGYALLQEVAGEVLQDGRRGHQQHPHRRRPPVRGEGHRGVRQGPPGTIFNSMLMNIKDI